LTRAALAALGCALVLGASARAAPADYPTEALADYVLGCMASNGESPEALRKCACSIDTIAAKISYDDYVKAETVLRMQQSASGQDLFTMFKGSPWATAMLEKLRAAQVEADLNCF
jgi:hypothetical protein